MPALAARLGMAPSDITLPILLEGDQVVLDSFDIALHVDSRHGSGLVPPGTLPEIRHYNLLCDHVLEAWRVLMMEEILKDPQAQEESLPSYVPGILRPPLRFMARMGVRYIQQEFSTGSRSPVVYSSQMIQALIGLDTALERAGGRYLIGDQFTLADILGALAVGGVIPSERMRARMGPAMTRACTQEHLLERFGRLIEWRDRLIRDHR